MKIILCLLLSSSLFAAGKVLIVADEIPAMELLAAKLKAAEGMDSKIVLQPDMPPDLSGYSSVIVYIHKKMDEAPEKAFIQYTEAGGNLVLLHHSISSGKRPNHYWFPWLQISLPEGDFEKGGYRWTAPVTLDFVNLAPKEYITTHRVTYPEKIAYTSSATGKAATYPGFRLLETEVYLNHVYSGPRTPLLGLKYTDEKTGKTHMQDIAGWYKPIKSGRVVYLMSGHSDRDFENPVYSRIVINAVASAPARKQR